MYIIKRGELQPKFTISKKPLKNFQFYFNIINKIFKPPELNTKDINKIPP